MRIGLVSGLAVGIPYLASQPVTTQRIQYTAGWMLVLLMIGLIAGYARRISGEADRQHSLALDRLGRLADANSLLFSLHRVTQTLPASLDLGEVLDTTIGRLRGLFEFDAAAIMVRDETDGVWQLVRREGARLPLRLNDDELPPPVRRVVDDLSVIFVPDLAVADGPGLAPKATSGLYAVLTARGATIGALVIESSTSSRFGGRDLELLQGFVEPVALAIDNARWFARLRTVGADEERTRIARDLHDRIGQSLAYLAFELDRIVAGQSNGTDVGPSLERLRDDVRGVIREVRDTLYDLRTDVSDSADLPTILEQFAARVHERADLSFDLVLDRDSRLPILQEREMWRIAQEAITNIERHAGASHVRVVWRCNGEAAALDITDDGRGFPSGTAGRLDSYGILGMRERASSIGATLDITSEANKGTRVRCTLLPRPSGVAPRTPASGSATG
jgi:signal transduction histidine kinase